MKVKTFLDIFIKELKAGLIYPLKTVVKTITSALIPTVFYFDKMSFFFKLKRLIFLNRGKQYSVWKTVAEKQAV